MLLTVLALAYGAWFALLLRSLCTRPHRRSYTQYKAVLSLGFVLAALACTAASGAWHKGLALQPALWCYLFGDVLLGLNNRKRDTRLFAIGTLAFLVGHLFLLKALARRQPLSAVDFLLPAVGVAIVAAVLLRVHPSMPGYYVPGALVYAFMICLAAAKCLHLALLWPSAENGMLAAGGLLFLLSDCVIPFVHFVPRRSLPLHILNLAAYYGGMFLLAGSLYFSV
ncbi:MAG: lysoplasmalogenase [Faecalibacterium sp.]|jgi:uncharacterized membrane protein YhhN|nr:lysoplasmalogenase [Faecalibacterium sp.]